MDITLRVNGDDHALNVEPRTLLVHALREELGLTGTKIGCDTSQCGACTVLVDGRAIKSCTLLAVRLEVPRSRRSKGSRTGDELHPLQQRVHRRSTASQCGFCTPGMMLAAADLLAREPGPGRRGDPARAARQPLPLHRLQHDHQGRARGGAGRAR